MRPAAILDEIDSQIRKYSALLIRYRMELGRRTAAIETNITGRGDKVVRTSDDFKPTKTEVLAELGISRQRASENERLSAAAEAMHRTYTLFLSEIRHHEGRTK